MKISEHQEREEKAKLEDLRRSAIEGQDAHVRGEYSVIEDAAALDRFFAALANETDQGQAPR